MLVSYFYGRVFQPAWETLLICIEICPASLELRLPMVVQTLPVVVNDKIGDCLDQSRKEKAEQVVSLLCIPLSFSTFKASKIFCSLRS